MDQISSVQIERNQRWADLVEPAKLVLLSLVDQKRVDENNHLPWLTITTEQKRYLLDWVNSHFSEFKDGNSEAAWSDPAKTAHFYLALLNQRKAADE
jgi:hypothetical protein